MVITLVRDFSDFNVLKSPVLCNLGNTIDLMALYQCLVMFPTFSRAFEIFLSESSPRANLNLNSARAYTANLKTWLVHS